MALDLPDLDALDSASEIVYRTLTPTPLINWPLLSQRCGTQVWVKHENYLPTGAFKIRGGLHFMARVAASPNPPAGVISATRGNHGQSIAMAAALNGVHAVIVVPHGNNPEKNAAMEAFGAELIEHGDDFQDALDHSRALAAGRGLQFVPSFHRDLILGVASYGLELFRSLPDADDVIVPIGLGSGLCSVAAARNALGMRAKIYGVVAENAPSYALSFRQKKPIPTPRADTLADGLAVRTPDASALDIILASAEDILTVADEEILRAMNMLLTDTHNLAEGAAAAPLAALLKEKKRFKGRKVCLVLTGGNADRTVLDRALAIDC